MKEGVQMKINYNMMKKWIEAKVLNVLSLFLLW